MWDPQWVFKRKYLFLLLRTRAFHLDGANLQMPTLLEYKIMQHNFAIIYGSSITAKIFYSIGPWTFFGLAGVMVTSDSLGKEKSFGPVSWLDVNVISTSGFRSGSGDTTDTRWQILLLSGFRPRFREMIWWDVAGGGGGCEASNDRLEVDVEVVMEASLVCISTMFWKSDERAGF